MLLASSDLRGLSGRLRDLTGGARLQWRHLIPDGNGSPTAQGLESKIEEKQFRLCLIFFLRGSSLSDDVMWRRWGFNLGERPTSSFQASSNAIMAPSKARPSRLEQLGLFLCTL